MHCRTRLHIVRRIEHDHSRDRAHQSQILQALMGRSVLTHGDSRMGRSDLHIEVRVTDRVAHLLVISARRKHRKRTDKRNFSAGCKTCRDSCHIRLGNTDVPVALRKCLLKNAGLCRTCQIRVQHDQIFMLFSKLYQCVAVTLSGCNLLS